MTSWAIAPATGGRVARGGQQHADQAQRHAADGALQGDRPQPPADVQELIDLLERAVQDHRAGRLGGDVAVLAEGDADRGGGQGRGVVDAVAEEHGVGPLRSPAGRSPASASGLWPAWTSVMPTWSAR